MTTTAIQKSGNTTTALAETSGRNNLAKLDMRDLKELGQMMHASGAFPDIKSAAQAMIKIMAGQELGFSPIVSMTGVHFFNGKVAIGANLVASLIKDSGKYEYKIIQHSDQACEIAFYQKIGTELKSLGTPVFYTFAEATKAGLTGKDNWKKYPKDMLFAACIRQGARRYCADVLRGVTPESDESDSVGSSAMDTQQPADRVDPEIHERPVEGEIVQEDDRQRADTIESIDNLLGLKFQGDQEEIDKFLNGRVLVNLPTDELTKIQGDLAAL